MARCDVGSAEGESGCYPGVEVARSDVLWSGSLGRLLVNRPAIARLRLAMRRMRYVQLQLWAPTWCMGLPSPHPEVSPAVLHISRAGLDWRVTK